MVSVRSITTPVFVRFAVSLRSTGLPLIQVRLQHDLALKGRASEAIDIQRAAGIIGLKARVVERVSEQRLRSMPVPAIVKNARRLLSSARRFESIR